MNLRNFRFNSDYPIDKIIFLREIEVSTDSSGEISLGIQHSLGAIPFCKAVISFDNWETTYQGGVNQLDPSGQIFDKFFSVSSDSEKIYLFGIFDRFNNRTAKVRVWGVFYESDTENIHANPTSGINKFLFNSDNNYQSLVMEGKVGLSDFSQTIQHGLGFVPNVDVWYLENGQWKLLDVSFSSFVDDGGIYSPIAFVDENSLVFDRGRISQITQFYYRIYTNEAI